jgi:protein gp37
MAKSAIEWADRVWNPTTGCTPISPGCAHCYARMMVKRLQAWGVKKYEHGFDLTLHEDVLEKPLKWKKPSSIFVNTMSDLFHEDVPVDFIQKVFDVMQRSPQHRFQVLTKRADRLALLDDEGSLNWPENVWMGVTVENGQYLGRIDKLRGTGASLKFITFEPLIGKVPADALDLTGIHWVIVGGESGPGARPMDADWARAIRDKCVGANVPFYFKQWGGVGKKQDRLLDGRTWDETPDGIPL